MSRIILHVPTADHTLQSHAMEFHEIHGDFQSISICYFPAECKPCFTQ